MEPSGFEAQRGSVEGGRRVGRVLACGVAVLFGVAYNVPRQLVDQDLFNYLLSLFFGDISFLTNLLMHWLSVTVLQVFNMRV